MVVFCNYLLDTLSPISAALCVYGVCGLLYVAYLLGGVVVVVCHDYFEWKWHFPYDYGRVKPTVLENLLKF